MEAIEAIDDMPAQPDEVPHLGFLLLSLLAMTALADFCLWRQYPRLSVGLFAVGATIIILLNRPRMRWTPRPAILVALLCGAAVESAFDLCFSNLLVLISLTFALAGETWYEQLRGGWSRWSEALWTMAKTPARWLWLMIELSAQARQTSTARAGYVRKAVRMVWILLPGLAVTVVFAIILGNGNALFSKFANDWTSAITNWILQLNLDFPRCLFWVFVAAIALPILWPSPAPDHDRVWTRELPLLPQLTTPRTARLQAAVMLALLNGLFCCVNTIDAIYLWARRALPPGVNFSAFVHQGVSSLIVAVIFSAILLAGLFQQARVVSGWMPMRLLGLLWIAQNLVLLAGVLLRVKLYLDAYDLTLTRVNLVFFLALVAAGFLLLAIHLFYQRTLGWLLHANMLATFFLFYTVQFLDTRAFVARYNVRLWQDAHETRSLDLPYIESLGPPAFDAIEAVARSGPSPITGQALAYIRNAQASARRQLQSTPWPGWQLRDMHFQRKILADPQ